jgi:hypothetical protein
MKKHFFTGVEIGILGLFIFYVGLAFTVNKDKLDNIIEKKNEEIRKFDLKKELEDKRENERDG